MREMDERSLLERAMDDNARLMTENARYRDALEFITNSAGPRHNTTGEMHANCIAVAFRALRGDTRKEP